MRGQNPKKITSPVTGASREVAKATGGYAAGDEGEGAPHADGHAECYETNGEMKKIITSNTMLYQS